MMLTLPVSAVVATCNRAESLRRTFDSLVKQEIGSCELIVVDASDDKETGSLVEEFRSHWHQKYRVSWVGASVRGAACQRNQGVAIATQPFIWFFDDDILFEPNCVGRLWNAIHSDPNLGGASAMIANQRYQSPGAVSRVMFTLMNGRAESTFAGKVIGPAINLLPEDRDDLPEIVPVEWLNTTCTMYRRDALPSPPFDSFFEGYSLMEDVALSLRVAESGWKLANARTARVFHDSQPGEHKSDLASGAAMELINRHYVMSRILKRRGIVDYLRLFAWEIFQLAACLAQTETRRSIWPNIRGKLRGARQILRNG